LNIFWNKWRKTAQIRGSSGTQQEKKSAPISIRKDFDRKRQVKIIAETLLAFAR
jgi:hypothetical protein